MTEVTIDRGAHLLETHPQFWTWEIPVYFFFAGVAAGIMLLVVLLQRAAAARGDHNGRSKWLRYLPFAVPVLLAVGMAVLFPHLTYKAHFFRFFTALRPASPMSWEAWVLVGAVPSVLLLGLGGLHPGEVDRLARWGPLRLLRLGALARWGASFARRHVTGVHSANLILGLALGAYPGFLLGTLVGRPAWYSAVLVPLFLVSALLTGAAVMRLLPLSQHEHKALRKVNLGAIALQVALVGAYLLWLYTGGPQAQGAAQLFLGGRYTAHFWALVLLAGLIVPLVLEAAEGRQKLSPSYASPVLILVGALSLRLILVASGQ